MRSLSRLIPVILLALVASDAAAQRIYHLSIGDPARKTKDAPVVLDAIVDTASGETITFEALPARLAETKVLLMGESHTAMDFHRAQLRVIRALHESGRRVLIGLEMYPYTEQRFLDQWVGNLLTEDGFLKLSKWYDTWGYHWHYYRDIFLYAREKGLPMHAVNTPREVVAAVRKKGFANLTPEESAHIPTEVDIDSADHLAFFKASFAEADGLHGGMNEDAWKGMLSAQATWDATMGYNAVEAWKRVADPKAIMVVLVGSGHVAYGVGISRQAARWFDGRISTFIPVPIRDVDNKPLPTVRASYADFILGIPAEVDSQYPSLGLSTRAADGGRQVLQIEKDSVGARAGFAMGDVLVSMDGVALPDREAFNRLMAGKTWGDSATFVVKRGNEEKTLVAYFRRTPPKEPAAAGQTEKPADSSR